MRINKTTMLFEDISSDERREMLQFCEQIVLHGKPPWPHPAWLTEWLTTFGYDERQALLLMATAIPQRVMLSLLRSERT